MDPHVAIPRIFLSLALGALIGLEREFTQKSAGLRTHILVTLGSTLFTLVSMSDFYAGLPALPFLPTEENRIVRDPTRVAAQIVAGIGFIGGGAVLRHGVTVRGLTTAASLWAMASIGMMVGIGQFKISIVATLLIFLVLFTIGRIERHVFSKHRRDFNRLRIHVIARAPEMPGAQSWVEENYGDEILEAKTHVDPRTDKADLNYTLDVRGRRIDVNEVSKQICRLSGVISSTVKVYQESEETF